MPDLRSSNLNTDCTLNNCLFGYVKLTKNVEPGKYVYNGSRLASHSVFPLYDDSLGKMLLFLELM